MRASRYFIIVLILLLGALGRSLHIAEHSFWIDEGFSFFFMQSPDLARALAADVHPPLYFAGLRLWSEIAGDSELALRWFSLLPSMLSLALMHPLAQEALRARSMTRLGGVVPPLAMLMLALADGESFLAQEARQYTWLTLLVLAGMLFMARWLRGARRLDFLAWLLASVLALYTHYIAAFALAAQSLYLLIWTRGKRRTAGLAALLTSALTLLPWLAAVGLDQLGNRDSYKVWSLELSGAVLQEIGIKYFTSQWALMIGLVALGCVTILYRRDNAFALRRDRITPLLLLWLLLPFGMILLVNEFLPFLVPRRLTQWTPVIALLVALGLGNIRQPIRGLMIAALLVHGLAHYDFHRGQPDWRQIAHLTTRFAQPGDLVLTDVASGDYPLRYYLLRETGGAPALEPGVHYESLQFEREYAAAAYDAWLPPLLDARQTVWLMYWSSDESAFAWLDKLDFRLTADFIHRHDGGALGETRMHILRFDRASANEPLARFGEGIALQSARLDRQELRLDTLWTAALPLDRDYRLSAKLLDAAGLVVAQHDSQPQINQRPTSGWQPGELIYSPHELQLVAPLPAGDYRLIVQVYTQEEGGFVNLPTDQGQEYAFIEKVRLGADS